MRHTVYRYFSIGAYEKEEKWLNAMSARGMQLVDASGIRYVFEEGVNGEYVYRLELLQYLPSNAESQAYLRFLEETGVEQVGSYHRWAYLRKKAADGPFEIYSDIDSKIRHYRRIYSIANAISIIVCVIAIMYFWEAYNQYEVYTGWIARGFSCKPYHTPLIISGSIMLALVCFVQIMMIPIWKSLRRLKKDKKISE
jgi:hypothetical protein